MQEKDKLQNLVDQGLSTTEISKQIGLSQTCTRYWLNKYKLKTKPLFYLDCRKKYSDEEILQTWEISDSVNQFLLNLGVNPTGGSWYHYQKRLVSLNIDIKNATLDGRRRGGLKTAKITNEKSIKRQVRLPRVSLKKAMDLANIVYECNFCGLNKWNEKYIHLHIHHKNHDKTNNAVENLEYLCPNCHSQQHYAK